MKHGWKKSIGLLLCAITLCMAIPVHAEEQVKISDKEYLISLTNAGPLYISNNTPVSGEIGSKVFFTYTVAEVASDNATQNGIIGAKNNEVAYPYTKEHGGTMKYTQTKEKTVLFEEGWTYVFRFERTEAGFDYSCAKLKDDKEVAIEFMNTASGATDDAFNYYGIYCAGGGGVTALLNHVRCYDEKGNDLGIHFNASTAVIQSDINKLIDNHLTINTFYDFVIDDKGTLAISNKYTTDSDVVYMEYEVTDVKADKTSQQGVIMTQAPKTTYPYDSANGLLKFQSFKEEETEKDRVLLREGAKYFICFIKKDADYDVLVQRTLNGKVESISFPFKAGTYKPSYQYFSLWLGEGDKRKFSASFKNFKCYDADGNNLGIQVRDKSVNLIEKGEMGNYATSKGDYYCEEKDSFVSLLDDKKVSKLVGNKIESAKYSIHNKVLSLHLKSGKENFDYTAKLLRDAEGNEYVRIIPSKVTFVVGDESTVVKTGMENAYRVAEPEAPTKKGNTFKGWCLGNGKAYDFDTVVTKSITLYAKWENEDGIEYLEVDSPDKELTGLGDYAKEIAIAISVVTLLGCVVICLVMVKGGKRNGKNKEKTIR